MKSPRRPVDPVIPTVGDVPVAAPDMHADLSVVRGESLQSRPDMQGRAAIVDDAQLSRIVDLESLAPTPGIIVAWRGGVS